MTPTTKLLTLSALACVSAALGCTAPSASSSDLSPRNMSDVTEADSYDIGADASSTDVVDVHERQDTGLVSDVSSDTSTGGVDDSWVDGAADVGDATSQADIGAELDVVGDVVGGDVTASDAGASQDISSVDTSAPDVSQVDPLTLQAAPFVDVTSALGIDAKAAHAYCAGVGDADGDGDEDLIIVQLNASGSEGKIHTLLLGKGSPVHVWSKLAVWNLVPDLGCTVVDHDGDGAVDLFLGGSSGAAIYLNDGKGAFQDASAALLPTLFDAHASSFAPVDLDGDGDLDLVVGAGSHPTSCKTTSCAYAGSEFTCKISPPAPLSSSHQDRVLIRGPTGALEDKTAQYSLGPEGGQAAYISAWDVDLDGDVDLLQGTDFHSLWLLRRSPTGLSPLGPQIGFHPYAHAMGWGVADFDGDGLLDVMLADLGPTALYRQLPSSGGALQFEDVSYQSQLAALTLGTSAWTPVVADFDHDGLEDVLLGVSMTASKQQFLKSLDGCSSQSNPLKTADLLLLNDGGKGWKAARTPITECGEVSAVAQSAVDIDGDGDLDLLQVRPGCVFPFGVVRVLRNDLSKVGASVLLRLKGPTSNTAAVGARVTALIGGQLRQRQVVATAGLGGGGALFIHFGLGAASTAEDVRVYWPDGTVSKLGSLKPGSHSALWKP